MRQSAAAVALACGLVLAWGATAAGQGRPVSQQQRPAQPRVAGEHGERPRGPGKWWQVYKSELRLNPDQISRIDAIFEATFPQLKASYEALSKREEQLSKLIVADDATEAEVLRQSEQIEAIRSELSKTRVLMLFRMRRVLSPEQRDKLQELQKERERQLGGPPPRR
jgi:Spy/CpxP family protein refolding chaperone